MDLFAAYHKPLPEFCNAGRWPQDAACVKEARRELSFADRMPWHYVGVAASQVGGADLGMLTTVPVYLSQKRGGPKSVSDCLEQARIRTGEHACALKSGEA